MALVVVDSLTKRYGDTWAVREVSFSVEEGEVFGLLGPNGAGKSTTLGVIAGLLTASSGSVTVAGIEASPHEERVKNLLGLVPQDIALYPRLSARANLTFFGELYGLVGKTLRDRVDEVLELVGLTGRAKEAISRYSGGMKRRVNLAAALLHEPRLLILDEPTVGVDPQSRNHIYDLVKKLSAKGTTVIYTSHYMQEVELLCDRVAIMDGGVLVAQGTVNELLKQAAQHQEIDITTHNITDDLISRLERIEVLNQVIPGKDGVRLVTDDAETALALAFGCFVGAGCKISQIEIRKPSLEGLFMKITGRALRD